MTNAFPPVPLENTRYGRKAFVKRLALRRQQQAQQAAAQNLREHLLNTGHCPDCRVKLLQVAVCVKGRPENYYCPRCRNTFYREG